MLTEGTSGGQCQWALTKLGVLSTQVHAQNATAPCKELSSSQPVAGSWGRPSGNPSHHLPPLPSIRPRSGYYVTREIDLAPSNEMFETRQQASAASGHISIEPPKNAQGSTRCIPRLHVPCCISEDDLVGRKPVSALIVASQLQLKMRGGRRAKPSTLSV